MRVDKFLPDKLYGFVVDDTGTQVFFHLGVFQSPFQQEPFPPPIVGEQVEVEVLPRQRPDQAAKASKVTRTSPAVTLYGTVESYDQRTGYGFVSAEKGESHYLHASEVLDGRLPLKGSRVRFYSGFKNGRPRACHVEVLS